jgi:hypothetical protein
MRILAIDPGPEFSAWCVYDTALGRPLSWSKDDSGIVLGLLEEAGSTGAGNDFASCELCAIEMVASYGMPVGREVFETVLWTGRFDQQWLLGVCSAGQRAELVYRKDVKMHLCASARANDATIRQALIDRYGPGKEKAIGRKNSRGPLYGLTGDCWAALAVAVTVADALTDDSLERAA